MDKIGPKVPLMPVGGPHTYTVNAQCSTALGGLVTRSVCLSVGPEISSQLILLKKLTRKGERSELGGQAAKRSLGLSSASPFATVALTNRSNSPLITAARTCNSR